MPKRAEAVLVLNAGSSSVKFSLYTDVLGEARPRLRGQIEGLQGLPSFIARDADDQVVHEQQWSDAGAMSHGDATTHLLEFLNRELATAPLAAVGHRVVHGGRDFTMPVKVDASVLTALERLDALHAIASLECDPERNQAGSVVGAHERILPVGEG